MAAFIKGGCLGLLLFAVAATVAVLYGGNVHANVGSFISLFVLGGVVGLIINAAYNRGRKDAKRGGQTAPIQTTSPSPGQNSQPTGNLPGWLIAVFVVGFPFALFLGFYFFMK